MDEAVAEQASPSPASTTPSAPEAAPAATTPEKPAVQDTILAADPVTPPAPAADGKEASASATEAAAFALVVPEGITVAESHLDSIREFAKANGLTDRGAQAMLDRDLAVVQAMEAGRTQRMAEQAATWRSEVEKHPTLGGEHFARTVANARRALSLAPPELHEQLRSTGYGNHPLLVAWADAVGAKMGESDLVTGDQSAKKVRSPADDFPNTPKELGGSKKDD